MPKKEDANLMPRTVISILLTVEKTITGLFVCMFHFTQCSSQFSEMQKVLLLAADCCWFSIFKFVHSPSKMRYIVVFKGIWNILSPYHLSSPIPSSISLYRFGVSIIFVIVDDFTGNVMRYSFMACFKVDSMFVWWYYSSIKNGFPLFVSIFRWSRFSTIVYGSQMRKVMFNEIYTYLPTGLQRSSLYNPFIHSLFMFHS